MFLQQIFGVSAPIPVFQVFIFNFRGHKIYLLSYFQNIRSEFWALKGLSLPYPKFVIADFWRNKGLSGRDTALGFIHKGYPTYLFDIVLIRAELRALDPYMLFQQWTKSSDLFRNIVNHWGSNFLLNYVKFHSKVLSLAPLWFLGLGKGILGTK